MGGHPRNALDRIPCIQGMVAWLSMHVVTVRYVTWTSEHSPWVHWTLVFQTELVIHGYGVQYTSSGRERISIITTQHS